MNLMVDQWKDWKLLW